jgi:hypothetical protein
MSPFEALVELNRIGFRFRLKGESVKVRFEGQEKPDLSQVAPLLAVVKEHKEEVRFFLKCHCPRYGGVLFGTINGVSRCMGCYWEEQALLYPDVVRIKH